ncbi:MAG: cobalamin biosynthesis protein [Lachnospiraceae bacterium]|nr:cobalamin biosynthesis protein [Lachnospiraceae bacterium]
MRKLAICFNENGKRIIEKINTGSDKKGISPVEPFILSGSTETPEGFGQVKVSVAEWTSSVFLPENALIFVGAAGIAVRALSGLPKDKLNDCPVIVIDDGGRFVIPLLSGHAGGANKLAMILADLLKAVPVITTSTDVNGVFSADTFAIENRLTIADPAGIKKVSVKALEGKKITLSIKDYPPEEEADIIVADDTDREYSLLFAPKKYTVGIGMKKNMDREAVERVFLRILCENGIDVSEVYAICTIYLKEDEEALIFLRNKYRIPLFSFDSSLLKKVKGTFSSSEFVEKTVGVDNVCERAAMLGAGSGGKLILKKHSENGMTIAIAERGSIWGRFM